MKCKNPKCHREARPDSKFCSTECNIGYDNLMNPRPNNEDIERKAILKSYFNSVILPNIPDENLPTLFELLDKALEISTFEGVPKAKEYLKSELEKLKNASLGK